VRHAISKAEAGGTRCAALARMRLTAAPSGARWFVVTVLSVGGLFTTACGEAHSGDPNGSAGAAARGGGPGRGPEAGIQPEAGRGRGGAGGGLMSVPNAGAGGGVAGRTSAAGRGGAGVSGIPEPTATMFEIRNEGEAALLLGSNCGASWLGLTDGAKQLGIGSSCACACDDLSACRCPAICVNTQELLVPGTSASRTWEGVAFDFSGDPSCYERHVPQPGDSLTARGCWNTAESGETEGCSAVDFVYGEDSVVTIPAKGEAPASSLTRLVLTNTTSGPIEVVTDSCGLQGWFALDMGPEIALSTFCPCECSSELKPNQCPTCGGCTEDVIQTLSPGEDVSFEWDGRFDYRYGSGCTQRYGMPAGTQVKGKFCWRKPAESAQTCVTGPFPLGRVTTMTTF
jgi:hypothetical protein